MLGCTDESTAKLAIENFSERAETSEPRSLKAEKTDDPEVRMNKKLLLVWVWVAAAWMTGAAVAKAVVADISGTHWMGNCVEAAPKNAPCIGYIAAMQDMNEMLTDVPYGAPPNWSRLASYGMSSSPS